MEIIPPKKINALRQTTPLNDALTETPNEKKEDLDVMSLFCSFDRLACDAHRSVSWSALRIVGGCGISED